MVNLIKRDIMVTYSHRFYGSMKIPLLMLVLSVFLNGNKAEYLFFKIPVWIVYFIFSFNGTDQMEQYNKLLYFLPIKRWEYVLSKYVSVIINYILIITYTLIFLWALRFWNFNHLDYLDINILRESSLVMLGTFSLLIPMFFMMSSEWEIYSDLFIISLIVRNFDHAVNKIPINYIIENIKSSSFGIMILVYFFSFCISVWIYNRKDLA